VNIHAVRSASLIVVLATGAASPRRSSAEEWQAPGGRMAQQPTELRAFTGLNPRAATRLTVIASKSQPGTLMPVSVALAMPQSQTPPATPANPQPSLWQPVPKNWWSVTIDSVRFDLRGVLGFLLVCVAGWAAIRHWGRRPNPGAVVPQLKVVKPLPPLAHGVNRVSVVFPTPGPGRPAAILFKDGGGRRDTRFPIEKSKVQIGTENENDLVIRDDAYVSRMHASIRFQEGSLFLKDLGSSNGTFRNGTRVGQSLVMLAPGDLIRFGHTTYELRRIGHAGGAAHPR
jgi:FHA domain